VIVDCSILYGRMTGCTDRSRPK